MMSTKWRLKIFVSDSAYVVEGQESAMKAAYEAIREAMDGTDGCSPKVMEVIGTFRHEDKSCDPQMAVCFRPELVQGLYLVEL